MPTRSGAHIGIMKDSAWIVKTPYRALNPKSKQKAFDSWDNNRDALVEVLRFAWIVERKLDPHAVVPFDFPVPEGFPDSDDSDSKSSKESSSPDSSSDS